MGARREEVAVFYSPGTLFAEQTSHPIASRDPKLAVAIAAGVVERYRARPFGFRFETRLVADPVDDGEGGRLTVVPRTIHTSGMHFLGGVLETLDVVEARNDPRESILRNNMRWNCPIVCVTTNGYRSVQPFEEDSILLDDAGEIVERGDDPRHVAYRNAKREALDAEVAKR